MNPVLLILALQAAHGDDTVYRTDPNRGAYQEAVDACRDAEKLLGSAPEAALKKLGPVFTDGLDKGLFTLVERKIHIEKKAQEQTSYEFYPYNLRGRARLLVARSRRDEEARGLYLGAAADLQTSLGKGAKDSSTPLAEAHKELWDNVRSALTYEGWKPGRMALVDQSLALLTTTELKEWPTWLATEVGRIELKLRDLRKEAGDLDSKRPAARQAGEWCDAVVAALRGLPAAQAVSASALKAGALAVSIRDSRGHFRLKIGVNPWATVSRLQREGEEIPLTDRDTPLLIPQELEIDNYTVELTHPNGRKVARISAKSLEPGRTYVLWGDMNGDKFEVSELPK